MGSKYQSQSVSSFNASPPVDDGSATEANKVKWSSILNKLASPLKTFAEAINTALVTALDQSCRTVSASDSAAATDHNRTIQVTTSSVTITLADASTMAAGYIVSVANQSSGAITVALATSTDTIDGVTNTTQTIHAKEVRRYIVNTGATGYITAGERKTKAPTRQVFTSGSGTYVTPAGASYILVRMVGGGGGGGGSGSASQTAGGAGGNSTFGSLTASGGGATNNVGGIGTGGTGGSASGSPDFSISGGNGASVSSAAANVPGGTGGGTPFGAGGGSGHASSGGTTGATNSGVGGGGAGGNGSLAPAGGGGGGAYLEHRFTTPAATYSYAVGAAGTAGGAGTSGSAGGAGGSGLIIVDEFY